MGAYSCTIGHHRCHVWVLGELFEHGGPNSVLFPACEAFEDAVPLAIPVWQFTPLGAGAQNPVNCLNETATLLLLPCVGTRVSLQKRVKFLPLIVGNLSCRHPTIVANVSECIKCQRDLVFSGQWPVVSGQKVQGGRWSPVGRAIGWRCVRTVASCPRRVGGELESRTHGGIISWSLTRQLGTCRHGGIAKGGVAGGVPPHKGGPERPDRSTAVARDCRNLELETSKLERRQPATDHRQPATDHRQPATDHRQPATDHRQPATDH